MDAKAEHLLRELAPQVLAALLRRFRDFSACEDAVQEALMAAARHWPTDGLPNEPRAWLIQVASRRVTDHVRRESARKRREELVVSLVPSELQLALAADSDESPPEHDDTLALLFMCCHPALTTASAIALTLRAVGGLTTAEIAKAFLVPEATMAQRISRAKQSIKASGVPFLVPTLEEREARLGTVLHVLYLIFNEGYTTSAGPALQRSDLASEAIRLTRMAHTHLQDDCEVAGLLALLLLTDARRDARTGPSGELIPLNEQDRGLWDKTQITEGVSLLTAALPKGAPGPYQLQAAIAALHDEAESAEATDWPQILALYGALMSMADNPMVTLNHAIAVAMVRGPNAGLELLEPLGQDPRLAETHRLAAVRAHLLEMAGEHEAAVEHYRSAANRTTSIPERDYLRLRAARLAELRSTRG
jgi:RNA polymerase sigma factor (sigma-70 family)